MCPDIHLTRLCYALKLFQMHRWNKVLLSILFLFSCEHGEKLERRSIDVLTGINHYCPERILWEEVAELRCPNNSINYHCLQLSEEDEYRDTCKERKVTPPGLYPILDSLSGNVDSKRCPPDRYQTSPMFSNDGNKCVYEKSVCSEEGQVVHTNGSRTEDRTCRCDYNKGYMFVSSPMDSCYCKPSKEDCSCYIKTCNKTSKINQDYICVEENSNKLNKTYNCPVIQPTVFDKENGKKGKDFFENDTHYNILKLDSKNRKYAILAILCLVLIYIVTMVLIYIGNIYNRYYGVAIMKHIPIEIQRLGVADIDMYKKVMKTEICKQRVIVLIIIGATSSGKTSLWHHLLGKRTGQERETNNILNKFYLTVKNGQWKVLDYKVRTISDFIQVKINPENEESKKEIDETIELIILDIPGGKEYYAAFEPFLSGKAIYLLLNDVNEELLVETRSRTKSNVLLEREPRIHLKTNGGLIRDCLLSIHSKSLATPEESLSPLTLTPSVILVGTYIEKLMYSGVGYKTDERHERNVLNCVGLKKKTISKHVSHSFVISNINTDSSELQSLKEAIIDASDKIPVAEIPVRYKMFEKLLDDERNTTVTLSFDEIHQLGKESGYPVTDRREIDQFLSYQHDVKNIIYHQEFPECVIISPNWLYSVIRQLLSAFHKEDENSDYKKKGLISLDLLNRIIGDTERNSNQTNQDIISILRKFDVVAVAWRAAEYKKTASYCYIPSVIPESHTVDLMTLFESERRGKTSYLCFSFDFLPQSLVNHVMVKLLAQYSVCKQNGNIAVYYQTLLVDYDTHANQKLYFLSNKDELLFQIWYYGVQQISPCFEELRKIIERTVNNYKSKQKINIAFTHKLRCPDSKHAATDGWDILTASIKKNFFCMDHKTYHEDLFTTWFKDTNQTMLDEHPIREVTNRNLGLEFERKSIQRASGEPTIDLDNTAYEVKKGGTLRLACKIISKTSMPIVKLIWWRKVNGHDVKVPVENVMKYRDGTRTIPSLIILDVKDDDEGLYWCEAINSIGPSFSETVKVKVEAENTEITDTKNLEIYQPFSEGKNAPSRRDIKKDK